MTKKDLVGKMAESAEVTKGTAEKALAGAIEAIERALKKGEKVSLVGFGTFSVVHRKARDGRNPKTGKPLKIKARKAVRFKPGKRLSESVKKK
jgi:DNA-binding protein HU-beta